MKKTRGKKVKASSQKKSNKPIPFLKIFLLAVLVLGVLAISLNVSNFTGNVITGNDVAPSSTSVVITGTGNWGTDTWTFLGEGMFPKIFLWIFGVPVTFEGSNISQTSAGIITIAMWLLLFITFSDIVASFSTFSKPIAWGIGFLISVIAANIGTVVKITSVCVGILAGFGSIAVVGGLVVAFAAFFAINLGIGKFAEWALRRKAIMSAHQASAGGKKVAGAVEGMGEIEKALARLGVKS